MQQNNNNKMQKNKTTPLNGLDVVGVLSCYILADILFFILSVCQVPTSPFNIFHVYARLGCLVTMLVFNRDRYNVSIRRTFIYFYFRLISRVVFSVHSIYYTFCVLWIISVCCSCPNWPGEGEWCVKVQFCYLTLPHTALCICPSTAIPLNRLFNYTLYACI